MQNIKYSWGSNDSGHAIEMAHVQRTEGRPFSFGEGDQQRAIEIRGFFIATFPVTQALWTHVMGERTNPSHRPGDRRPVETSRGTR